MPPLAFSLEIDDVSTKRGTLLFSAHAGETGLWGPRPVNLSDGAREVLKTVRLYEKEKK